jgi:hypothetical protein
MSTEDAITQVENTAELLGLAQAEEARLEDERPIVKQQAILRIMQATNPLTLKAHSASSAEAVVETDEAYMQHRRTQRDAVLATQKAWGAFKAATLRAQLAVSLAAPTSLTTDFLEAR